MKFLDNISIKIKKLAFKSKPKIFIEHIDPYTISGWYASNFFGKVTSNNQNYQEILSFKIKINGKYIPCGKIEFFERPDVDAAYDGLKATGFFVRLNKFYSYNEFLNGFSFEIKCQDPNIKQLFEKTIHNSNISQILNKNDFIIAHIDQKTPFFSGWFLDFSDQNQYPEYERMRHTRYIDDLVSNKKLLPKIFLDGDELEYSVSSGKDLHDKKLKRNQQNFLLFRFNIKSPVGNSEKELSFCFKTNLFEKTINVKNQNTFTPIVNGFKRFSDNLHISILNPTREHEFQIRFKNVEIIEGELEFLSHIEDSDTSNFSIQIPKKIFNDKQTVLSISFGKKVIFQKTLCYPKVYFDNRLPRKKPILLSKQKNKSLSPVSIVIVNRNGESKLEDLFNSYLKYEENISKNELIVIDNCSSDNSINVIKSFQSKIKIKLIENNFNDSFSSACNKGADIATKKQVLFLNNDIIFSMPVIRSMQSILDDSIKAVGIKLKEMKTNKVHHSGVKIFNTDIYSNLKNGFGNSIYETPYEIDENYHISETQDNVTFTKEDGVTAAALLMNKNDFQSLGGFDENYFYGWEDVDLMIKINQKIGEVACVQSEELAHKRMDRAKQIINFDEIRNKNIERFLKKNNLYLRRRLFENIDNNKKVCFIVKDARLIGLPNSFGDIFTALELAKELNTRLNCSIYFSSESNYISDLSDMDVVINMLPHTNAHKKYRALNQNCLTINWVRFDPEIYLDGSSTIPVSNINLASSFGISQKIESTYLEKVECLPLATSPNTFFDKDQNFSKDIDVLFVGSSPPEELRTTISWLIDIAEDANLKIRIYGEGFESHPVLDGLTYGVVEYNEINDLYNRSKIVIDDAQPGRQEYGSINSRFYDAYGAGSLCLTNCDLSNSDFNQFSDIFFKSKQQLQEKLNLFLSDEALRQKTISDISKLIKINHTYGNRADKLISLIEDRKYQKRIGIITGIPAPIVQRKWGDFSFAISLRNELIKCGYSSNIYFNNTSHLSNNCDALIHIHGLIPKKIDESKYNILWIISHPDTISDSYLDKFDQICVASELKAASLMKQGYKNITFLPQFADKTIFNEEQKQERIFDKPIYIGNSRNVYRDGVKFLIDNKINFDLIGDGWNHILHNHDVLKTNINTRELKYYYSKYSMVICDHWEDMKNSGFIANRILESISCGCLPISDNIELGSYFKHLPIYKNSNELKTLIDYFRNNEAERSKTVSKLQKEVDDYFTLENTSAKLIELLNN